MKPESSPRWTHEALLGRIHRAPFNAWLGIELLDWDAQGLTLALKSKREILGHATLNAVHGGVLGVLIDVACSMAVIAQTGESVFTVDMRVDYHRPATSAEYRIRADVLRSGKMLATADARITTIEGKLIASGRTVLQHALGQGN